MESIYMNEKDKKIIIKCLCYNIYRGLSMLEAGSVDEKGDRSIRVSVGDSINALKNMVTDPQGQYIRFIRERQFRLIEEDREKYPESYDFVYQMNEYGVDVIHRRSLNEEIWGDTEKETEDAIERFNLNAKGGTNRWEKVDE